MKFNKIFLFILLIFFTLVLTSCRLWTVVDLNKENAVEKNETIVHLNGQEVGLESYVESLWIDKIIPYLNSKVNDIRPVLNELDKDSKEAGNKYGVRQSAGKPWKFVVEGRGRIVSVNTESRVGTIDVDIEPYDERGDIKIQIGPVIRGTSIRDSLDFISFNNFENQIEYAKLSTNINKKINNDIMKKINFQEGQEIVFQGVFVVDSSEFILTPYRLEVVGGNS